MSLDQRFAGFKAVQTPDLWSEAERRAVSPSIVDLPVHLASRQWGRVIGGVVAAAVIAALFLWPFLGLTGMRGEHPTGPMGTSVGPPVWVVKKAMLVATNAQDPNPTSAEWVLTDAKLIAPAVGLTPDQVSGTEYLVVLRGRFKEVWAKVPAGAPFPTGTVLAITMDPVTKQLKDFGISNGPINVAGLTPFALPFVSLSPAPPVPTKPATTGGPIAYPIATCMSSQLSMSPDAGVSAATGQNPRVMKLTNTSSTPCHLEGYPNIVLLDKNGNPVPFVYRQGGDQMITSQPPTPVALLPGGSAYLMINKYRCDLADITLAGSVKVTPPGSALAISMKLELSYCGPGDPGSVVSVSPIEPTVKALLAH